jgi:hypothetical protein
MLQALNDDLRGDRGANGYIAYRPEKHHPKPTVPREIFTAQLPLWDRHLGAVTACSAGSDST